ncbi:MAG: hypothetical protein LLG40_11220 [Deltaproteobacteria bacterium]|nr:hypothetical protein [Deltaproteobacteria bacterium]
MKRKKLLEQIRAKNPALLDGKDEAKLSDQEIETLARMAAELSMDDIRQLLRQAVKDRFSASQVTDCGPMDISPYIEEVYPAYLIYEIDGKYYKIAWSILDGKVTLGETPTEVESTWVEARSQQAESDEGAEMLMRLGDAQNPEGTAWDVTICEVGFTKNGWYIPEEAMRGAEALFEKVDVNLYEMPAKGATHVPDALFDLKSLLVKNKVGWIDTVKHVAGVGLKGVLHFLDSAKWLGKNLLDATQKGASVYGLSYDCPVRAAKAVVDGKDVFKVLKFIAADSVDIVTRPAAGGKFNRAVASVPAQNEEDFMKQKLLALIKKIKPDLLKGKDEAALTDQEVEVLARMAMDEPASSAGKDDVATKADLEIMRCGMALDKALGDKDLGLPEIAVNRIRKQFEGRAFASAYLDAAITSEKEYLASIAQSAASQHVAVVGAGSISGGLGSFERACMAADKLFGLTKDDVVNMAKLTRLDNKPFFGDVRSVQDYDGFDDVPAFSSIRDMYTYFTGDAEVSGRFNRKGLTDLRNAQDITSGTFTFVLGNTLGRRLVAIYRAMNFMENMLVSVKKTVKDFRTQEAVLVGGFPDLSAVDPEAADYQEIAGVTDEESTYSIGQRGNILTITRKTIVNDDISIIQRLIDGLARAARRTHAKYVWGLITANANCSDGTAIFTAGHGNLGATALSFVTALAGYIALGKMTEKDSGERIGLLSDPSVKPNLIGPVDLVDTVQQIAEDDYYFSANDLTTKVRNALKGKVNGVTNPLFTDTNNWFLMLPPDVVDIIEMGYLNGREEPELLVADMPQSEQVFVADKIRHKIRHEYNGAVIDYRGGYGAIVA